MDFFAALTLLATSRGISDSEMTVRHEAFCQNLYWQPNASEKLEQAHCDREKIGFEISRVQSGKY